VADKDKKKGIREPGLFERWKRKENSPSSPGKRHPDFKFTCSCGFESKTTPVHNCKHSSQDRQRGHTQKKKRK
jgi:hypothetical protein